MYSIGLDDNGEKLYDRIVENKCLVSERSLYDFEYPVLGSNGEVKYRKYRKVCYGSQAGDYASIASITCRRCKESFRVDPITGFPVMNGKECKYHPKGVWNMKHRCCGISDPHKQRPCCSYKYHVHDGDELMTNYKGFVETQPKPEREPNKHGIYPLDCEMCHTTMGIELTRVTLLDHNLKVIYDKLVKPKNPIVDYNTEFSGIKPGDLDNVTTTLEDVQRDFLELFSSKSIIVGHSLESDTLALKLIHKCFVDTSLLYEHPRGPPRRLGLAELMSSQLGETIRRGSGHDSKEDAAAAFKLLMKKINKS